jgi:hypothetical protein
MGVGEKRDLCLQTLHLVRVEQAVPDDETVLAEQLCSVSIHRVSAHTGQIIVLIGGSTVPQTRPTCVADDVQSVLSSVTGVR